MILNIPFTTYSEANPEGPDSESLKNELHFKSTLNFGFSWMYISHCKAFRHGVSICSIMHLTVFLVCVVISHPWYLHFMSDSTQLWWFCESPSSWNPYFLDDKLEQAWEHWNQPGSFIYWSSHTMYDQAIASNKVKLLKLEQKFWNNHCESFMSIRRSVMKIFKNSMGVCGDVHPQYEPKLSWWSCSSFVVV